MDNSGFVVHRVEEAARRTGKTGTLGKVATRDPTSTLPYERDWVSTLGKESLRAERFISGALRLLSWDRTDGGHPQDPATR